MELLESLFSDPDEIRIGQRPLLYFGLMRVRVGTKAIRAGLWFQLHSTYCEKAHPVKQIGSLDRASAIMLSASHSLAGSARFSGS